MIAAVESAIAQRREAQLEFWEAEDELRGRRRITIRWQARLGRRQRQRSAASETAQRKCEAARRHFERAWKLFSRYRNLRGRKEGLPSDAARFHSAPD